MHAPEHLCCGEAGGASADDHDAVWCLRRRFAPRLRFRLRAFLSHENPPVTLLDGPACDGTQGGRAQGFAAAQVETGVVPGTAHGIANHEPVPQRAVVMRALSADREDLSPAADEQDWFAAGIADYLAAVGELAEGNALGEFGPARLG
jgi:hypothetical protein